MPDDSAQELFRRGNALYRNGDLEGAAELYRRALQVDPAFASASFNLGCTLDAVAGPAEALPHFQRAAALRPEWFEAHQNAAFALARTGRMAEAVAELETATSIKPNDAGAWNNLGLALNELGRGEEAFQKFQNALELNPFYPEAHNNLAMLFERYGRSSEAIASCQQALKLRPSYPEAHNNLANALKSQGRHAEAIAHYREALRLRPDFIEAENSLLFALCYPSDISEQEVVAEHLAFGTRHSFPAAAHANDPSPDRPLMIGYVSADFRSHAVARFIEPVLRHHDRSRFRICCYSNVSVPDDRSRSIGDLADSVVNVAGLPNSAVEQMIRRDGIDILVDLSGHTAGNRLLLFARKPAPVQVTWLGYPHTTGLRSIDYRIADAVTDPPGASESHYSEMLLRLPGNFSCFEPPAEAPEVLPLPRLANRFTTFCSFNNPAKITPETVALWAAVLQGVPSSRMLVKGYSLADQGTRELLLNRFAAHGITADRLELLGNTPSYRDHLALYGRADIALDTTPYNGTTTTCEALWMGVPVVTLAGATHRSRVGASLLRNVGLEDLAAVDRMGYCEAAFALAGDVERLSGLRRMLRQRMAESPLTDGAAFTAALEQAFREIWHTWCLGKGKSPLSPLRKGGDAGAGPLREEPAINLRGTFDQVTPPLPGTAAPSTLSQPSPLLPPPLAGGGQGVGERSTEDTRDRHQSPTGAAPLAAPAPAGHQAMGEQFLQAGRLDDALKSFLSALKAGSDRSPLGGVEATLNRMMAADLAEAVNRDARRLGMEPLPGQGQGIKEETLEEVAETLADLDLVTPADLLCRYLQDRGRRSARLSRTLGKVALAIGQHAFAVSHFRDAIGMRDDSLATRIQATKAAEAARVGITTSNGERFLLVKAWGYGFWSDVNHVLGQLLVAEMTGRIPVVQWGGNSLFSDDPRMNAFESFFSRVSEVTQEGLSSRCRSFYPPKWNANNLAQDRLNQAEGPWSRCSSLYSLERGEDVVVSDFHYAVHDLVPWIPLGHRLHGMTTDELYLYLFRRYLKVRPAIEEKVEAFYRQRMAGTPHLALHVRGGDKGGEDANLAKLNSLYHAEIQRHLQRMPRARLLLITDDQQILSDYLARYGKMITHTCATRTGSDQGVHYQDHVSRYRLGEEVLVDALLACRCDGFIGNGLSNVSCAIAQMKQWAPTKMTLLGARLDRLRQVTLYRS